MHILPMSWFENGDKIFGGCSIKGKIYQENDILIRHKTML